MRIEILESAHDDLLDGFWFYENQEAGLGDYFMDSMYAELGALRLYAGIHVRRFDFYRAIAKRFPYSIYYEICEGVARVYAVLDDRRDPDWIVMHLADARRKSL